MLIKANHLDDYKWYKPCEYSEQISQGDILTDCPVIKMIPLTDAPYYDAGDAILPKVIVVTQACDLEQRDKVNEVAVCLVAPLTDLLKEIMQSEYNQIAENKRKEDEKLIVEEFDYSLSSKTKDRKIRIIDDLRKGSYLDYYVLNKFDLENAESLNMSYQVVYLRTTYYLPIQSANSIFQSRTGQKLQLLPPYREHLAQAYTRNFMRIGLPVDISINSEEV